MKGLTLFALGLLMVLAIYAVSISIGAGLVFVIANLIGYPLAWKVCFGVSGGLHLLQNLFSR